MNNIIIDEKKFGFLRAQFNYNDKFKYSSIDNFIYQGNELAHYTNLYGLQGIIESNGFWLSDHRFLNDAEEYDNGKKIVLKILTKILTKKRYFSFKKVIKESIKLLETQTEEAYYICSFSTNKDNLNQWKGYAKNDDGVSIVFHNNTNDKMFGHFCIIPIFTPSKVIYSDLTKCKIILNTIRKFYKEFKVDLKNNIDIDYEIWASSLCETLSLEFINFKHKEFESESEVRLSISHSQYSQIKINLLHRVADSKIIPYINIADLYNKHLKNKKLPIKEIIVGPTSKQNLTYQSIKVYLKNLGYNDVILSKSKVPYRG